MQTSLPKGIMKNTAHSASEKTNPNKAKQTQFQRQRRKVGCVDEWMRKWSRKDSERLISRDKPGFVVFFLDPGGRIYTIIWSSLMDLSYEGRKHIGVS
jgi:hypothetical protein